MAERVRLAVQAASTGRQVAPTVSTASARQTQDLNLARFTLSALLVNSYCDNGSVAAGDTLCAVRAAADEAGVVAGRPTRLASRR
ncbi:MAG: hypothetical protein R3F36_13950 [Candidatus Competibacteraceae bacterium]